MDLLYKSDFWLFYNVNYKEINKIINYYSNKYKDIVDLNEMSQEIILRLACSDVLIKYNPNLKVSLKTYFTNRVKGYASHIVKETFRKPESITMEVYNIFCEKENDYHKYNYTIKDHIDFKQNPSFNETINDTLYSEEIMQILEERLDKTHYLIACLYLLDCYTCMEIYQLIKKISYNTIVRKISEIKSMIEKLINLKYYVPVRYQKSTNSTHQF
jgi:hypothetical protein